MSSGPPFEELLDWEDEMTTEMSELEKLIANWKALDAVWRTSTEDEAKRLDDVHYELVPLLIAERDATCTWREDDEGVWQTECGDAFEFTTDGPEENNVKYCCYCGKWIVVVKYEPEQEVEK